MAAEFLSTKRINDIFDRHYGSKRALAHEAGVSAASVTNILHGKGRSQRILDIAEQHAREYLAEERRIRKSARKATNNNNNGARHTEAS